MVSKLGERDKDLPLAFERHAAMLRELIVEAENIPHSPLKGDGRLPDRSIEPLEHLVFDRCTCTARVRRNSSSEISRTCTVVATLGYTAQLDETVGERGVGDRRKLSTAYHLPSMAQN